MISGLLAKCDIMYGIEKVANQFCQLSYNSRSQQARTRSEMVKGARVIWYPFRFHFRLIIFTRTSGITSVPLLLLPSVTSSVPWFQLRYDKFLYTETW